MDNKFIEATKRYPSDLSDAEWEMLSVLIPDAKKGGRRRSVDMREVLNAIFYMVRSGCSWRMLPRGFPPRSTGSTYFYRWRDDGTMEKIHDILRERVRKKAGKESEPTAALIDSRSVKTAEKGGFGAMMRANK